MWKTTCLSKRLGGVAHRALQRREQQAGGQQAEPVDVPADFRDLAIGTVGAHPEALARVLERQPHLLDGFVQARPGFGIGQLLLKGREPILDLLDHFDSAADAVELDRGFGDAAQQRVHLGHADADALERLERRRARWRTGRLAAGRVHLSPTKLYRPAAAAGRSVPC